MTGVNRWTKAANLLRRMMRVERRRGWLKRLELVQRAKEDESFLSLAVSVAQRYVNKQVCLATLVRRFYLSQDLPSQVL